MRSLLECVNDKGYAATTIADVVASARVSRNAFYEFFSDKEACFLEACDEMTTDLLDALYAFTEEPRWTDALRKGMRVYLQWWVSQPNFAVAYLVELPAAGRRALEHRDRVHGLFAAMFDLLAARARSEESDLPQLPRLATRILTSGITDLVEQEIREGREAELMSLEDDLVYSTICVLADDGSASREREVSPATR
jgi:AcrR family transcriptional regulator